MASQEYISASEVATQYGVSLSTVRRRISEGKIFKGAKKRKMDVGERWFIPRSEVDNLSLEEISPKLFQEKRKSSVHPINYNNSSSSELTIRSLEERVARLERLLIKVLDKLDENVL
jgi:hypothetical protein